MSDELDPMMFFNGINAEAGGYLLPEMDATTFANIVRGVGFDKGEAASLQALVEVVKSRVAEDGGELDPTSGSGHYAAIEGVDYKDLASAGWGVIFTQTPDPAVKEALQPLLDWRREQAGDLFRVYEGLGRDEGRRKNVGGGYRKGETKDQFITRNGSGPGPVDPKKIPYYLLIVGDAETIPFAFQYQLDVQHAVGRVSFDKPADYHAYAMSVVRAEKEKLALPRRAAFFGVANPDDRATQLSAQFLIEPLMNNLRADVTGATWDYAAIMREQATKGNLHALLHSSDVPAFLFTASHGMGFPFNDKYRELMVRHQGALLCQDWPGPKAHRGPIPEDFYFSGDDLSARANLTGLIAFLFACYGAGTPQLDEFAKQAFKDERAQVAPYPFVAGLPKKMLAQGALAAIGHVERAWGHSFIWGNAGPQLAAFTSAFKRLQEGHPIGSAFEYFNMRYAELASEVTSALEDIEVKEQMGVKTSADDVDLAGKWTAHNDARNYVVLGDPAVRLPIAAGDAPVKDRASLTDLASPNLTAALNPMPTMTTNAVTPAESSPSFDPGEPVNYGLADLFGGRKKDDGTVQPGPMRDFLDKLGQFLAEAIDDATSLQVRTYVSGEADMDAKGNIVGGKPRAATIMRIDGDMDAIVPVDANGRLDLELFEAHRALVDQAQRSRTELLQAAITAGNALINLVRK